MAIQGMIGLFGGAGRIRRAHGFTAEHAGYANFLSIPCRTVKFTQAVAQLGKQWIVRDRAQICDFDRVCQPLSSRRPDGYKSDPFLHSPRCYSGLGTDLVAGIDHTVHGRQAGGGWG